MSAGLASEALGRRAHQEGSYLADQSAELCGAQVSIDITENRDGDHDITQDAAQIVKRVDTDCRRQKPEGKRPGDHGCALREEEAEQDQAIPWSLVLPRTLLAKAVAPHGYSFIAAN